MTDLTAFLWGVAEATLFFIVPDVAISVIALDGTNAGLRASVFALIGALLGGTVMYYWGRSNLKMVVGIFHRLPAIRPVDVERVRAAMIRTGVRAILIGPLLGIPYKIYAAHAHLTTSITNFLLVSIPARMVRFVLVALATPYLMEKIAPTASYETRLYILVLVTAAFYLAYFVVKSRR
jgi:membrane protein YqaA with SNARE-associated domain